MILSDKMNDKRKIDKFDNYILYNCRLLLLVEKEVLVRREGWEVDILVTATDLWSVH